MTISQALIVLLKRWEFRRHERMSRPQLQAQQLRKFRRLAAFSNRHSPYYADIVRERGIDVRRCEPAQFPVITKTEVLRHFDRIVTDRRITKQAVSAFLERSKDPTELFLGDITVVHTSGSSGEVGLFVFSRSDWARGMAQVGRRQPLPNPFRRRKIASYHATDGHYGSVSWLNLVRDKAYQRSIEVLLCDINSPLPEVVRRLNDFQPDSLGGYVTGTRILADEARAGRLKIAPKEILVGGEVLLERDRLALQQTFGCPVVDLYGCSEHHAMAQSLPGSATLHLWEDDLIFELYDDHTVVTNLYNRTLPLIRYRMSDVLVPTASAHAQWPYRAIERIDGRTEDTPRFVNADGVEDFISHHTINEIFVPGVRRFQMQLTGRTSFRFVACLQPCASALQRTAAVAGLRARLDEILGRKRMHNVAYDIVLADDLPVDPKTRKFRLIVDATLEARRFRLPGRAPA